jgi:NAD(P)-dependent dehydrogenase (short-subunit alcohol dehydrogenase family)
MGNFTPVKRVGTSDEIAAAALYLASDDSRFMLGAEILLDGGLRDL